MANLNPNSTNYFHSYEPNTNDLTMAMDYNPSGEPIVRVSNTDLEKTPTNRLKVSSEEILYFNTFQYNKDPDFWDEQTTGTASGTYDSYLGQVAMSVGSAAGDQIIRQTRRVIRYVPGRQNEIAFGVRFEIPTAGVRRRLGLFNELNGFYFEDNGGTYSVVLRRNTAGGVIEDRVVRDDWNFDQLDGNGPSGITADATKQQMVVMDYDWYGAGQVIFKWVIDGVAHTIHTFNTGNTLDRSWASTAFLPIRLELTNVSGASGTHYMWQSSCSVIAEGVEGRLGTETNVSNAITGKTTGTTANVFRPMVAVRLKSTALGGVVIPIDFQAATLDNTAIFYRLVLNPTLTGAVWTSSGASSFIEYDITATVATGGTILKTGYISPTGQGQVFYFDTSAVSQLGRTNLGTVSDILCIEIASVNANKTAFASMNFIEVR